MSLSDVFDTVHALVEDAINNTAREMSAEDIGLDNRSAPTVYVFDDAVAIGVQYKNRFDYYGGGEYVDDVRILGDYVFYMSEDDDRVSEWISRANEVESD